MYSCFSLRSASVVLLIMMIVNMDIEKFVNCFVINVICIKSVYLLRISCEYDGYYVVKIEKESE